MEQHDARIGDEDWDAVYRRVRPRLLAYARRRLDRDAAEEAVSETLARAVTAAARYEERGLGVDAWLFGICRNVVLDSQRQIGRRRTRSEAAAWTPDDPGPLDAVIGAEDAVQLRRAFAQLPEADRELLELRVVAGLDAEAVAELLGKRAGAVRMAQSRALAKLRQLLAGDDVSAGLNAGAGR